MLESVRAGATLCFVLVIVCQIICPQLYLSLDNVPGVGDTVRFRQIVVLHALLHIGVDDVINLPKYIYF